MHIFGSFDVLVPHEEYLEKWAVIACDQFTSQPDYWKQVKAIAGNVPSAVHCILPEAELNTCSENRYSEIKSMMQSYLCGDVFRRYPNSFVYVERTLNDGSIRVGIVGVIDLEEYDFHSNAISAIRATEMTVEERLPPRMKVRCNATLELSHVLLLCDDEQNAIISALDPDKMSILYDFELMQNGGHIKGWLVDGTEAQKLQNQIDQYCDRKVQEYGGINPILFLVGDGNHSLATAKACYEELKKNSQDPTAIKRARYAMVELENIRDAAQQFEPIHRVVSNVDTEALLSYLSGKCCCKDGYPTLWVSGKRKGTIYLDNKKGVLPLEVLQSALDEYLEVHQGSIDYIHGEDVLLDLAKAENTIGFQLQAIPKESIFGEIANYGVLPRKTFSMGLAKEKRYYLEAREI